MTDLTIIVPTRSRPHTVVPLMQAFADTCRADTRLVFVVDGCPRAREYRDVFDRHQHLFPASSMAAGPRRRLIGTLNYAATLLVALTTIAAVGYLGDDHRPRSVGWDAAFLDTLAELGTGLVYGDDGHHGEALPTSIAMTGDIVAALGYMVPPALTHMYCDNFWLDLGHHADAIAYLPDVKITHYHPGTTGAAWDDSYAESNSPDSYRHDQAAYAQYCRTGLADDVAKVVALRHPRPSTGEPA